MIREILASRELVWNLIKRDLKTRYKASMLGFFWSFMKPLLLMLILWFVFSTVLRLPEFRERNPEFPFALHLLSGVLAWTFFTGGLMDAMVSVYVNANLIKKVQLNAAVFPIASVLANLINYLLALLVLGCFMAAYRIVPGWPILLMPLIILLQTFWIMALALLLSCLYVFFRDMGSIMEVALTGWFYATPVIYPFWMAEREIPARLGNLVYYFYLANPMIPIVAAGRRLMFSTRLNPPEMPDIHLIYYLIYCFCLSSILYLTASRIFQKQARRFADEL